MYNWKAIETAKLCPTGWHVPTDKEWIVLEVYLTANGNRGKTLRATSGWDDYKGQSGNGTDNFGWLGLPCGFCGITGEFFSNGYDGYWWTSSEFNESRPGGAVGAIALI